MPTEKSLIADRLAQKKAIVTKPKVSKASSPISRANARWTFPKASAGSPTRVRVDPEKA